MSKFSTCGAPDTSGNNIKTSGSGGNNYSIGADGRMTITITGGNSIKPDNGGGGRGNSSTVNDSRPGYFGDEILALVRGLSPAETLLKMPDIINLLVKSAEAFDIAYKTNLASKVAKLSYIDYHNPYVPDRYLDTTVEITARQQKLQISALTGRAFGISIGVE